MLKAATFWIAHVGKKVGNTYWNSKWIKNDQSLGSTASYARPSPHTSPLRDFRTWYLTGEGPGSVATKVTSSDTLVSGSSFNCGIIQALASLQSEQLCTWVLEQLRPWLGMIWDWFARTQSNRAKHMIVYRLTLDFSAPQVSFWSSYLWQTFYVGADSPWCLFHKEWSKCIAHDSNYASIRIYYVERKRIKPAHASLFGHKSCLPNQVWAIGRDIKCIKTTTHPKCEINRRVVSSFLA